MFDMGSGLVGGGCTPSDRAIVPGCNARSAFGVGTLPSTPASRLFIEVGASRGRLTLTCSKVDRRWRCATGDELFRPYGRVTPLLFALEFNQSNDWSIARVTELQDRLHPARRLSQAIDQTPHFNRRPNWSGWLQPHLLPNIREICISTGLRMMDRSAALTVSFRPYNGPTRRCGFCQIANQRTLIESASRLGAYWICWIQSVVRI
jgi:hypothetical protein